MKTAVFTALIIIINISIGWLVNLPHNVGPDVPSGKLNSLSFAPYREGQGPLNEIFPTPEELDADMRLMGEKTHSIRTYASAEGTMPLIPALAKKYGLTMIQGAWLGGLKQDNSIEVAELIRSANANPDVVKRVIVGNEVLLRGDLKPDQLLEYIREVKRSVKQPVSYADVWSMYMKYPELIKEVDFITIHILPYWEDEPITVDQAPMHIERIFKQVHQEAETIAPGKPILIGESGWPGAGRQRGWSVPSVVNEAKFIRALIEVAQRNGFDYNIVEAFNQSWKSALEGVVGANWGLYSVNRQEVFPLTGLVYEHANWPISIAISSLLLLLVVMTSWRSLNSLSPLSLIVFLILAQTLTLLLTQMSEELWRTSYNDWQRLQTAAMVILNTTLTGLLLLRYQNMLNGNSTKPSVSAWIYTLFIILVAFAVYKTFCLTVNGRYISFPISSVLIAAFGLAGMVIINQLQRQLPRNTNYEIHYLTGHHTNKPDHDRILGYALLVFGTLLIIWETKAFIVSRDFILAYPSLLERSGLALLFSITNGQLMAWELCLVILSLPLLAKQAPTENA